MPRKSLLWQLNPFLLLITVFSLLLVSRYLTHVMREFYLTETAADLQARVEYASHLLADQSDWQDVNRIDALCKSVGASTATRITVILPDGKVVGDTRENPQAMDNHADRAEIRQVLLRGGLSDRSVRFSHTLGVDMMYVAGAVVKNGQLQGVIRTSLPLSALDRTLQALYIRVAVGGGIIMLIVFFLIHLVSRKITGPLAELQQGTERFAQGDLSHRLAIPKSQEIGSVALAMNEMARQLDQRITTTNAQRHEQQAVLSSMVEAVLALDTEQRVLSINLAAARLIGKTSEEVVGRYLQETLRNAELEQFVKSALESPHPLERQIVVNQQGQDHYYEAHGSILRDGHHEQIGVVIVLDDVTPLRRLEAVRKDFVANVSHELKTPLTTIKGFVETLQEGALDDPKLARKFLDIMARQIDRLDHIIEDLLYLSQIEQQADRKDILFESHAVQETLEAAIQTCENKITAKEIRLKLQCDPNLRWHMNASLLEQAVINLLDNAVNYSEPGGRITVTARGDTHALQVQIRDYGCGIQNDLLPRLFERFYRVDKARSRQNGGTGLGLAIVKHIAEVHGGSVTVESQPGSGSLFMIHLPAKAHQN